jgi:hypothetical protein
MAPASTRDGVRLAELLAAWSLVIDVGMAMPLETGLRVCSRAVRLAERMGGDADEQRRVYYLALLRHIGCTAENPELAGVVGDEIAFRAGMGGLDVSSARALFRYLVGVTVGARPPAQRPAALVRLLASAGAVKRTGLAVGEVARLLVDRLGFGPDLIAALREDLGAPCRRSWSTCPRRSR